MRAGEPHVQRVDLVVQGLLAGPPAGAGIRFGEGVERGREAIGKTEHACRGGRAPIHEGERMVAVGGQRSSHAQGIEGGVARCGGQAGNEWQHVLPVQRGGVYDQGYVAVDVPGGEGCAAHAEAIHHAAAKCTEGEQGVSVPMGLHPREVIAEGWRLCAGCACQQRCKKKSEQGTEWRKARQTKHMA